MQIPTEVWMGPGLGISKKLEGNAGASGLGTTF